MMLGDTDVYKGGIPPTLLRTRVGMVFQRPNPFPTMSIYDNVVSGLRFNGITKKSVLEEAAESALIAAALWDSVVDRLKAHASTLSGGEQQRLCIARALAVEPEVLLMDEPTSSLDPISTRLIEELMGELKSRVTIVIVTHNMQQAARVSDLCAFFLMGDDRAGEQIEVAPTKKLFTEPDDQRTLGLHPGPLRLSCGAGGAVAFAPPPSACRLARQHLGQADRNRSFSDRVPMVTRRQPSSLGQSEMSRTSTECSSRPFQTG